jgi:hypothetical protein
VKSPEAALAAHIVSWLESEGWDVYQEVSGVDIVARRHGVVWTVECKTILSFNVLDQAVSRIADCHCAWVATPPRKNCRALAAKICSALGIGWMTVTKDGRVNVLGRPFFNRRSTGVLGKAVRPEHKTFARAGSSTGRSWTPFKETCRNLVAEVVRAPGVELRVVLKRMKHHYKSDSSALRSLTKMIEQGFVPGLTMTRSGDRLTLHTRPLLVVAIPGARAR